MTHIIKQKETVADKKEKLLAESVDPDAVVPE
jgi:hypothetical protein